MKKHTLLLACAMRILLNLIALPLRGLNFNRLSFTMAPPVSYHKMMSVHSRAAMNVSVKFSSVIHLTVDNYYLRGFGFISISV